MEYCTKILSIETFGTLAFLASFKDALPNYTTPVGSECSETDNFSFSTLTTVAESSQPKTNICCAAWSEGTESFFFFFWVLLELHVLCSHSAAPMEDAAFAQGIKPLVTISAHHALD